MQSSNKAMKPRHCFLFPICAVLHHSCATPTGIASTMTQGTPKIAADNVMGRLPLRDHCPEGGHAELE